MPRRRSTMRGGGKSPPLSPNTLASPDLFSSVAAFQSGRGCPYNYGGVPSAAGKLTTDPYVPLQSGGTGCALTKPFSGGLRGPGRAGPGDWTASPSGCSIGSRPLGLDAGGQASQSGGRKHTRKHTRKHARKHRRRFHKGTKSKTHKGKDFETRKSSKRYRAEPWMRGRKTRRSPIFPFVGGQAGGGPTAEEMVKVAQQSAGACMGKGMEELCQMQMTGPEAPSLRPPRRQTAAQRRAAREFSRGAVSGVGTSSRASGVGPMQGSRSMGRGAPGIGKGSRMSTFGDVQAGIEGERGISGLSKGSRMSTAHQGLGNVGREGVSSFSGLSKGSRMSTAHQGLGNVGVEPYEMATTLEGVRAGDAHAVFAAAPPQVPKEKSEELHTQADRWAEENEDRVNVEARGSAAEWAKGKPAKPAEALGREILGASKPSHQQKAPGFQDWQDDWRRAAAKGPEAIAETLEQMKRNQGDGPKQWSAKEIQGFEEAAADYESARHHALPDDDWDDDDNEWQAQMQEAQRLRQEQLDWEAMQELGGGGKRMRKRTRKRKRTSKRRRSRARKTSCAGVVIPPMKKSDFAKLHFRYSGDAPKVGVRAEPPLTPRALDPYQRRLGGPTLQERRDKYKSKSKSKTRTKKSTGAGHRRTRRHTRYHHPKKGQRSRTRKGLHDFTTKKSSHVFNRHRHYQRKSRKGVRRRPYRRRH